jgi:hypothetical protein
MKNSKLTQSRPFSDEVNIQFNMLGALVMYRVIREVDRANVVAESDACLVDGDMKFTKQIP